MSIQIIKRLYFSTNHSLFLNLFSMRSQHAAIAMITHDNLLLMKAMKKETIPTEAPTPCKNVSIKIEIWQV